MSTSVVRAARILDRLARSQTPMTLAEIASKLDDGVKTAAARATIAPGGITPNHHVLPRNDHADQTIVARRQFPPTSTNAAVHGGKPLTGPTLERFLP